MKRPCEMLEHLARPDLQPSGVSAVAKDKPNYTAATFRRLLAKLAAANAEARPAIEAQLKEIYELASPGFTDRFISLFWNQWRSSEDANEYLLQRNRILEWLAEFVAAKRKPHMEKARQRKANSEAKAIRNKRMVEQYLRTKSSWDDSATKLMVLIGNRHGVKQSVAHKEIKRGLEARGLKSAKPRRRDGGRAPPGHPIQVTDKKVVRFNNLNRPKVCLHAGDLQPDHRIGGHQCAKQN